MSEPLDRAGQDAGDDLAAFDPMTGIGSGKNMLILWISLVGIPFGFAVKAYVAQAWVQFGLLLGVAVVAAFCMYALHRRRGEI